MDLSALAKTDKGAPAPQVEDRGTMDYYNADGTFSTGFKDLSNQQARLQQDYKDSAIGADVAETGMSEDDAAELYRKKLQQSRLTVRNGSQDPQASQLPLLSVENPLSDADKIDLSFADPRAEIPQNRIVQRGTKAAIALDADPKQTTTMMSDVQGEAAVRQQATAMNADDFRQAKQKYVDELIKNRDPSKPMTLDEANFITQLSQDEFTPQDPQALEKLYAQKVTTRLFGSGKDAQDTLANKPEDYHNVQDAVEQNVAKKEIAQKYVEDNRRNYETQTGIFGKIWNWTEQMVPFKSDLDKYSGEVSSWLPGSNIADQARNLWLLPPRDFAEKFDAVYQAIAAHNPLDAQDWAESMLSYSRMSEGVANVMFGVDVATTLPIGWIFKGGKVAKETAKGIEHLTKPMSEVTEHFSITDDVAPATIDAEDAARWADDGGPSPGEDYRSALASKQITQALSKEEIRLEDVLPETGHQAEGIDAHVGKIIANADKIPDVRDPSEFVNLSNTLDSMYNPRGWLGAGSRLGREGVDRIMNKVTQARMSFTKAVSDSAQAMRLTKAAEEAAVVAAKGTMREEFRFANDGVIDHMWVVRTQDDNPDTQINELIMTIGTPDGLAFREYDHAIQTADHTYKLSKGDYNIEPHGGEYYIQVKRPLDERDPSVASAMITTGNETPRSIANTLLGWWRNPDDLLSSFSRENRKAVTSLGQNMQKYFADAAKPIGKLSNTQKTRLSRMMEINRDWVEGKTRGRWFDSVSEYEQEYNKAFHQWPTEKETQAYMLTREISDFDWSVRSLTILRDKSRQGIVNVHTKVRGVNPDVKTRHPEISESYQTDAQKLDNGYAIKEVDFPEAFQLTDTSFEGKLLDKLPESKPGDGDPSVYIVKEGENHGTFQYLSDLKRDEIDKLINDEGYKVYQQADSSANAWKAADPRGGDRNFVILKNAQTSGLRAEDMLPYRAGYHVEYAPGFYTKQGKFYRDMKGRLTYGGDTSVIYHVSEAAARKYTRAFEQARLLLKEGKTPELKAVLQANLPHTYEQFVRLFSDGTLDIDTPVLYTKSGHNTRDSARAGQGGNELYDSARDAYNSPYNMSAFVNRQFAQEKDLALPSIAKGSEGNPLHNFVPAKMIDPLSSLSRSMHNMVRMRVYDNYQYQGVTSFVEEFANPETLGGSVTKRTLDSVRNNPMAFITDPLWNEKAPRDKLAAAKNAHRAIVNLLGVQSELNRNVDWIFNKVIDSVFERWGDGAASKTADFLHTKIKDPARYARSIAFHAKLGLFNPVQLFLQAQSVVHGAAITGDLKRSYQAMGAGSLMRYLSLTTDENIIKSFAKKAKVFGWSENDFIESFENMKSAGIWHVEGEVADLNDIFSGNMFRGKVGQFLDKGVMFFQEGERFVRLNAWNTAYKEWKVKNPGKVIGNRERNEILRRYDDLAINMTRSSTGAWQQGILSIPAQFSTYQIHLAEQMLGKRLTTAEKTRVLATYSALYGVPTGIAAGTALWPWGVDIKQAALERGIDINNGVMDTLLNGIMATGFEAVTGREYNFSERYGPNGLTFFKEALKGDKKGLIDLMLGPSGQIGSDILTSFDPVAKDLLSIFHEDNYAFPVVGEDLASAFRNVSTINNTFQMYYAMNAGKFMSKNEMFTSKADTFDGIMKGIFGLDPRSVSDAYIKIESMTEFKAAQDAAKKEVIKNYRRAMENYSDHEAFKTYMTAARSWIIMGGFRPDQMEDIVKEAHRNSTSLVDNIENQWPKRGPAQDIPARFEQQMQQRNQQ